MEKVFFEDIFTDKILFLMEKKHFVCSNLYQQTARNYIFSNVRLSGVFTCMHEVYKLMVLIFLLPFFPVPSMCHH